jgi:fructokinase
VSLGELLVDMFPAELGRRLQEVSAFRPVPGGAPANVAVAAARLGRASAFIGKVGDEAFGHHLANVLGREGVSTRGIRFDPQARTTMAFIAKPNENQSEFVFYRNPGADMLLRPDELDRELLLSTRVLHVGSISLIAEPSRSATVEAVQLARSAGALISFDVNYRPSLWTTPEEARPIIEAMIPSVHLLKVNETELTLLCGSEDVGKGSRELLERGPQACVVTLGPQGSYFRVADGGGHVPGFAVRAVDATGCGDAFIAALLTRLLAAGDWRQHFGADEMRRLVRYANAAGALTAQKLGVIPALPTADEVEAFLKEHLE